MNYQQALNVVADIEQGQGAHHSMADLGAAVRVLISATGTRDINTDETAYAAYRTVARYQSTRRLLEADGWR
jgi:hypothetical protein